MHRVPSIRRFLLSSLVQQCSSELTPISNIGCYNSALRFFSSEVANVETSQTNVSAISHHIVQRKQRLNNISKALQFYLENLKAYEKMMVHEKAEFELGKRHLANIMGWPNNMIITQKDIDRAISYLFPSGLTDPKALPVMKPPEEILPKFKKMEFDDECRPKDTLFYTITPKFYYLMSEINEKTQRLVKFYDQQLLMRKITENDNEEKPKNGLVLVGSEWLSKEELSLKLGQERLTDDMYASCILALEYLCSLPLSHFYTKFIMSLRRTLTGGTKNVEERAVFGCRVPFVQIDAVSGRRYADACGKAKRMVTSVRVTDKGTGKYLVDGIHYGEFRALVAREVLLAPLIVTDLLGKIDIEATIVENPIDKGVGGQMLIPRAVRHGAALGIAALFPEHRETLRLAGLLTLDVRKKERSKINQPGARAKWIWKKR